MPPKYLIDANLPLRFGIWNGAEYIHQLNRDPSARDIDIWNYALAEDLVIITKDSDFFNRIILSSPPPKVIHIRLGNMSMKDFHAAISSCWAQVLKLSEDHKLVTVYKDRIEAIR